MDEALAKELQNFRKRAGGSNALDGSSKSRKRKGGSGVGGNDTGHNSAVSGLLRKVEVASKRPLPPQIIKSLKSGSAESTEESILNMNVGTNTSYRCNSDSKLQLLGCLVNYMRDTYFREILIYAQNKNNSDKDSSKSNENEKNDSNGSHSKSKSHITASKINHAEFTIHQLLDKTHNLDASATFKIWLTDNALRNNPRVKDNGGNYSYRPPFELSDKKDIVRLLEFYFENGYGGISLDDLRESMLKADHSVKAIRSKFFHLTRSTDKKDVLYLFDPQYILNIDSDFINEWTNNSLESVHESDIRDFLRSSNIKYMDSNKDGSEMDGDKNGKKGGKNKRFAPKVHNTHLPTDMLQDYSYKGDK